MENYEHPMYICDPKKNTECKKTSCQTLCFMTKDEHYALHDETVIPRHLGEVPQFETRAEANNSIDKNTRYKQILRILKEYGRGMTAKEISVSMFNCGFIPDRDRNHVSPRLTELMGMGYVEPIGKTTCQYTGKTVTVFRLRGE